MRRNRGGFAAAFALSLALAAPIADAQKSGGVLIMSHFDSPASMSMHEEATGAVNRPMMGVFNNRRLNGLYKRERRPGYRYLGHAGHSVASLALPSAIVCHCMFHGASAPPRFSGMT